MANYTVKQGDQLSGIAEQFGFADFKLIWDHANNAALKKERKNPHILFPGDVVFIPDKQVKTELRPTTKVHEFELSALPLKLNLKLIDVNGNPRAKLDCQFTTLHVTNPVKTGDDGMIRREIPRKARDGRLNTPDLEVPLLIGDLDPIDKESGQIARLNNLGYEAGDTAKSDKERFQSAVEEFQCDNDLRPVTGVVDDKTRAKLEEAHGS